MQDNLKLPTEAHNIMSARVSVHVQLCLEAYRVRPTTEQLTALAIPVHIFQTADLRYHTHCRALTERLRHPEELPRGTRNALLCEPLSRLPTEPPVNFMRATGRLYTGPTGFTPSRQTLRRTTNRLCTGPTCCKRLAVAHHQLLPFRPSPHSARAHVVLARACQRILRCACGFWFIPTKLQVRFPPDL